MSARSLARSKRVPKEAKLAFKNAYYHTESPQQSLWREVACRAVLDAFGDVGHEEQECVTEALHWFRHEPEEVETVFTMGAVELAPVLRALKEGGLL